MQLERTAAEGGATAHSGGGEDTRRSDREAGTDHTTVPDGKQRERVHGDQVRNI